MATGGIGDPTLWSVLGWDLWNFRFILEAKLGGLWNIIDKPDTHTFRKEPACPERRVAVYTLSNGKPDNDTLTADTKKYRVQRQNYLRERALYEDQLTEEQDLKDYVQRTVSEAIFLACCHPEMRIDAWYANIKAHVAEWQKQSGASRPAGIRSLLFLAHLTPRPLFAEQNKQRNKARLNQRRKKRGSRGRVHERTRQISLDESSDRESHHSRTSEHPDELQRLHESGQEDSGVEMYQTTTRSGHRTRSRHLTVKVEPESRPESGDGLWDDEIYESD
jgi:hypothetical protein